MAYHWLLHLQCRVKQEAGHHLREEGDPTIILIPPWEKITSWEIALALLFLLQQLKIGLQWCWAVPLLCQFIPPCSSLQSGFLRHSKRESTQHLENLKVCKHDRKLVWEWRTLRRVTASPLVLELKNCLGVTTPTAKTKKIDRSYIILGTI